MGCAVSNLQTRLTRLEQRAAIGDNTPVCIVAGDQDTAERARENWYNPNASIIVLRDAVEVEIPDNATATILTVGGITDI